MNYRRVALFLNLLTFPLFQSFSQTSWEIEKDKDGIKVYTKVEKDSGFKSFKAQMQVSASVPEILEILTDVDGYARWYGFTKAAKLLKQKEEVQYNYVETIFPWPYSNRDMVYRMSIHTTEHGAVKISLEGIPDYIPEKKGIVRMKKAEGYMLLQPSDDKTEVIYIFHSEPGDQVPAWLANKSIAELPFKTLIGLREMLGGD
ncbi:START domain-containing protein [Reichenbachiella faecimaris]|uniref:START domain-containing protein n=1 Tax=Reichenbachiella faecimaris TaxID=692418 RepID=A0A1W2GI46_REIFA|nr:START domain-containing protein [Reichenbachiella faecimaris]SMD36333.1 START domain-containing protein [Reichenbachiella faecimaris]